jgi:hypothetical protein
MPFPDWPIRLDRCPEAETTADPPGPVPTLIAIPCLESFSEEELQAAGDSLGRRHAAVWELAESGQAPDAIATATGRPIGEIELILALKRRVQSAAPKGSRS